jgi:hypothetical protein
LIAGWKEFSSRRWVWLTILKFGLFQLSFFPALFVLGPEIARTSLGGAGAWGAILSVQAAGSILGGLMALRVRPARPLVAVSALTLPSACLLALLAAAAPVWTIAAVALVAGGFLTFTDIVWFTELQQRVPAGALSRISSFDWFGSVALNPIGFALIGPLAGQIGVSTTIYGSAAINGGAAIAVALAPSIRAVGREGN